jgi:hypothetical protein
MYARRACQRFYPHSSAPMRFKRTHRCRYVSDRSGRSHYFNAEREPTSAAISTPARYGESRYLQRRTMGTHDGRCLGRPGSSCASFLRIPLAFERCWHRVRPIRTHAERTLDRRIATFQTAPHRSGTLVFVLVMVMVPTGLRPCEGLACPPIATTGAPDLLIPKLSRTGQQCAPNSYVQTLQSYPVDAYSEGWGSCDVYVLDEATGNCVFDRTEQRGVVGVNV